MIWFLERESDLLICEIRREGTQYAFEVAPSEGPPHTRQYNSPRELIDHYLRATRALKAQGWKPRSDIEALG
jgi:hypothetical protein